MIESSEVEGKRGWVSVYLRVTSVPKLKVG